MKTKTIKIEQGYLLIDEDAINCKIGDTALEGDTNNIVTFNSSCNAGTKKIIASSFPLEGIPTFETLPNTEDDVDMSKQLTRYVNEKHTQEECIGFIAGYKQAKSETMFSLEDMKECYNDAIRYCIELTSHRFDNYIQSLTKQPEYEFVVEMIDNGGEDWIGDDINGEPFWNEKLEPKIIKNKIQGVWKLIK